MPRKTYLIVGATRGIGLEFTSQLLGQDQHVISTYRANKTELELLQLEHPQGHLLEAYPCDVTSELSAALLAKSVSDVDVAVLNAGVLVYPGRISEV